MDPLTHALTGAALAGALPMPDAERRGLLFGMFMSAAPDLDVLPAFVARLPRNLVPGAILFDPYWMRLHRGATHSLFFALVFGLAAGWMFWRIGIRKGAAWKWPAFAALALLAHVLLDLLNAGVALWAPFSDAWASLADLPVVDPFLLVPLLCCFFATVPPSMLRRRKSREGTLEHAWRRCNETAERRYGARKIARYCLLFVGIVVAVRVGLE